VVQPFTDGRGDHFLRFHHVEDFTKATTSVAVTDGFSDPVQRSVALTGLGSPSCAYIRNVSDVGSGVRLLDPGEPGYSPGETPSYFAHCEMESAGGGWTLALRVLGGDQDLEFSDGRWPFGRQGGQVDPGLAFSTGVLASYGEVPVDELLIGFQSSADLELRMLSATVQTPLPSLRAAFANRIGPTTIPLQTRTDPERTARDHWLRAVNAEDADLPPSCNEVALRRRLSGQVGARIGLLAGDDDKCAAATGFAGIGGYLPLLVDAGPDDRVTAGGDARDGQFVSGARGIVWVRSSEFTDLPARESCAAHFAAGAKLNGRYLVAAIVDAGADAGTDGGAGETAAADGGVVEAYCDAGSASAPICRNGVVEPPEQCDDGNGVNGDGLTDLCDVNCTGSHCGNGIIGHDQYGNAETCDPPDGTSCDDTCQLIGGSS
jgi:cysteine-rich repeat protein